MPIALPDNSFRTLSVSSRRRQPAQKSSPNPIQIGADAHRLPRAARSARHRWTAWVLGVALLAGLAVPLSAAGLKQGDPFPDLAAFKLEGKLPSDLEGKVILVDFWASWCGPCKQSFPAMEELHQRYAAKGLVIIAVSVDEKAGDMESFLKKGHASFTVVRDVGQKLVEKAGVATMPSSFLLDRGGRIRFAHSGYRGEETKKKYAEEIESLLKPAVP